MNKQKSPGDGVIWREPDGTPVSCVDKILVLNDNLEVIRQECQDALEDALLMGCDEKQVRSVFDDIVKSVVNPFAKR